ncbi:queuosine 5'-phosphate N-glycosylase/hydrolase-like isoform X2 [Dysidea avara]|uniref:queuosine 5'-phosphate N-glycosylase/hydrolase-like isoform X2 n=1 Tax=Dysidea avara TaxID=196820 RepID=UPI00332945C1
MRMFVLDVLNFCFWSDSDVLFTVSYSDSQWTGYRALRAAFLKAIEAGTPIHKPSFYASITKEVLSDILRSTTSVDVPMLKERVDCLQEAGKVLIEKFGGSVQELVKESGQSAIKLVELLFNNFSSFRDVAVYKGQKVFFLKRAQIFVSNVWSAFGGSGYGTFHDINTLSMFADYRVPQTLQFLGVLNYSDSLLKKLQGGIHIEQGSGIECEIRGCSIHAVELIRKKLCLLVSADPELDSDVDLHAVLIDCYLWNYAKDHREVMKSYPIHKTYTIFY